MEEESVAVVPVETGAVVRRPVAVAQLASKDCLVCGRAYRYSHNARRHELTSHNYDRYTNKVKAPSPTFAKLRPNPYNPKARLLPNPANPKMQMIPKSNSKPGFKHTQGAQPYPVRIRSLADLQNKGRQPEILKSLLTGKPEMLVSEPEIMRSGSESPETLISEPELAAFQVETIITEPDTYVNNSDDDSEDGEDDDDDEENEVDEENQVQSGSAAEVDSDEEVQISPNDVDINKIIGVDAQNAESKEKEPESTNDNNDDANKPADDEVNEPTSANSDDEESDEEDDEVSPVFESHKSKQEEAYDEANQDSDNAEENNDDEEDEDLPDVPLTPIVEINENPDAKLNDNNLDDEHIMSETIDIKEMSLHSMTITPTQKSFMTKYRDIIEQVNTMTCNCCNKSHPRRKAVIQHLQKNGHRVPKYTCYNCVVTFGHIGALLSHMRANVCTDAWKLIYEEGGIPDSMISEASVVEEYKVGDASGREDILNKSQYKDILNARSYACKLCPAKFQLKQFIMKHVLDMHENGGQRVPLCCIHCKYRFKDNRLWKKHIRNGECTVNIACELCNERFMSLQHFNDHALSIHAGGFVDQSTENLSRSVDGRPTDCPICKKNTASYHNLVKHLKAIHNEDRPHMCQHCDNKFQTVAQLNQHIYKEHSDRVTNGDGEHETDHEVDQDQVDLSIVKQEVTTYNYSCTDCSSMFDTVDGWTQHQIDAHNHTAYECDQCDKKFLQDSELIEHKNTHLRVKFYSCTVCSNSYSSPQRLSEHMMKSHPGEATVDGSADPFFCEMCMRSFKSRQAFSNHMRIHAKVPTTNKKPGEAVKQPTAVRQPVSQNLNYRNSPKLVPDAPYNCDICGKGFLHKKNIWKHKKILHPEVVRRMELENSGSGSHFMNITSTEDDEYTNEEHNNSTGLSIPQFDSFTSAAFDQTDNSVSDAGQLYQCDLCDKKFAVKSSIWKHKRVKHGIINPNLQDEGSMKQDNRTCCTICKINFSDKRAYYRHRKNVHKVNIQSCKICSKALNSTLELYEHYKAAHAKELLGYNASQGGNSTTKLQAESTPDDVEDNYSDDDEDGTQEDGSLQEEQYQARYPCDSCGKTFLGMMALQNHNCVQVQAELGAETFDCEICNKSYTSISALKSHRGWHLRSPDGKAAFSSSGLWMPHNKVTNKVSKHEVLENPRVKHSTPIIDNGSLQIKRKLPPDVQMTLLKKKKLSSEVTVELVQTVPRNEQALAAMQARVADESKVCHPCGKEFTKRAAYMRHMEEVHRPNSVFCPICNKSFTRRSTLLVHMRKHGIEGEDPRSGEGESEEGEPPAPLPPQPERLYSCDLCNVRYTSAKSLRRHCVKHHNIAAEDVIEERAAPGGGGGNMGSTGNMVGTRVIEVGGSRHKCGQCGEEFASDKDMWQHRHFSCTQCGMFFSRQQYLTAHLRARHQNQPPPADSEKMFFPCNMCDRFYMNKKSLQRHVEASH